MVRGLSGGVCVVTHTVTAQRQSQRDSFVLWRPAAGEISVSCGSASAVRLVGLGNVWTKPLKKTVTEDGVPLLNEGLNGVLRAAQRFIGITATWICKLSLNGLNLM